MLQGVAKQIRRLKFLLMNHFLADAVGIKLGLLFLKKNVTYTTVKPQVDAAMVNLQSMVTTLGPYLKQIIDILPVVPLSDDYFSYKDHDMKDSASLRAKFREAADVFIEHVVTHLNPPGDP